MTLETQTIVIIGGGSGIGFATARKALDAVLFLMGNRFMTGSVLYPDGGYVLP